MRIALRILLALLSVAVVLLAFRPAPDPESELLKLKPKPESVPSVPATLQPPQPSGAVAELLGGNQIRAGKQARDTLRAVEAQRQEDLRALGD